MRTGLLLGVAALAACAPDAPRTFAPAPGAKLHEVSINRPARLTSVTSSRTDGLGRPMRVPCATCHQDRPPRELPSGMDELDEFHQGMSFAHGNLACASCHVKGRADALHLADGAIIPTTSAMELCAQCHGPQLRDYSRGSHGGMTGYWDLSRGPRQRNHCVDCHDPHAPRFLGGRPAPPPRDRSHVR